MAEISASSSSKPLLPQFMQPDDEPAATEPARRKANTQKTSLFPFISRARKQPAKKLRQDPSTEDTSSIASTSTSSPSSPTKAPPTNPPATDECPLMASVESDDPIVAEPNTLIELEGLSAPLEGDSKDVYRWAVVYENQRGITIFSIPYYSHLSLLPWDPPPFTLPDTAQSSRGNLFLTKSHKPTILLSSYPLPNGDWKWVSKSWMIDMRGDGQVQYDGFEYNWLFRKHKWSATSAAWVRRRRWIRLMMRPAKQRSHPSTNGHISSRPSPSPSTMIPANQSQDTGPSLVLSYGHSRYSWRSGAQSHPPSVLSPHSTTSSIAPGFIWQGDGMDDWERCHDYLRSLTRDGKKLEVWKLWLGLSDVVESEDMKENVDGVNVNKKQWTEDEGLLPSQGLVKAVDVCNTPPREWIVAAIREHMDDILQTLVYPDSRAQFISVLRKIQGDLGEDAEKFLSSYQSDFWSYTFLNPGALASSASMSVKDGKRKERPPTAEDTGDSP